MSKVQINVGGSSNSQLVRAIQEANPAEGIYKEVVLALEGVECRENETAVKGLDVKGKETTFSITKRGPQSALYLYLTRGSGKTREQLWRMARHNRTAFLNRYIEQNHRTLKFIFGANGDVIDIVTSEHKQIPWSLIREAVEEAARRVFGTIEKHDRGIPNYWTFRMPLENKYVDYWLGLDAGDNRPRGRCAIYAYSRYRTIAPAKAPCLNWAFWSIPTQFFKIPVIRLSNVVTNIGEDKLKPLLMRAIHVERTDIKPELFVNVFQGVLNASKAIDDTIVEAVKAPLTYAEQLQILEAYEETKGLADYVVDQIKTRIQESGPDETIWGFSQAISWVRTHGDFRESIIPVEQRGLTNDLESMAGEIISLTPTITDIRENVGGITKQMLLNPESQSRLESYMASRGAT